MDNKMFILGLLFVAVDVFAANVVPVAAAEISGKHDKGTAAENYQLQIQQNRIEMISSMASTQAAKAKELQSTANAYQQVTQERRNYYNEYKKLADSIRAKAKEIEQKIIVDASTVEGFETRSREWESKSRESDNHAKDETLQAQRKDSEWQEWNKRAEAATVGMHKADAGAAGFEKIANCERLWSVQLRGKADEFNDAARNHYTAAKEAEEKAAAEKAKAQQYAEEAEKHLLAAKSLQEQLLKAEAASLSYLSKYIIYTIKMEEDRMAAKEEELSAAMEEMRQIELTKRAEIADAIIKILTAEINTYSEKAKKEEGAAFVYSQTARHAGSTAISHGASIVKLATAREDSEIEAEDLEPSYLSDHVKPMPFAFNKIVD